MLFVASALQTEKKKIGAKKVAKAQNGHDIHSHINTYKLLTRDMETEKTGSTYKDIC